LVLFYYIILFKKLRTYNLAGFDFTTQSFLQAKTDDMYSKAMQPGHPPAVIVLVFDTENSMAQLDPIYKQA
jgi:hypothetical protein